MQNDFITEMFGIKERCIEVDHIEMVDNAFHVHLSTKQRCLTCPRCKQKTGYNHNYRTQPLQGRLIEEKPVTLYLQKRRYACKACGKTFYEPLKLVKRYQRRTTSLNEQLLVYASENSFTMAGKMSGVTTSSVLRSFDHRSIPEKRILPQVIAIDEFKGDADNEKFQTIIVDVEKKEIIEVLPDRRVETVEEFFQSCDTGNVQVVVMDMSRAFKHAVQRAFGNPMIIADRFHFMRQAYWALDSVRRRVQHQLTKSERLRSKRSKKLLWMAPEKLNTKGRERVNDLLALHPDLQEAYRLKNALHHWFKTSSGGDVKDKLHEWFDIVENSYLREFDSVVKTFKNWKTEILNAFVYKYNNGYIEGVNNTTKVIKRMSYGIKSFQRLRKKILFRQAIRSLA